MDFNSLLNQFERDVKHASGLPREQEEQPARKRLRREDASTFPPVSHVYCICPAGIQTGGPEALHQLCHEINRKGKASVLYVLAEGPTLIHASRARKPPAYGHYDAPTAEVDILNPDHESPQHLLIWPEIWTDKMLHYIESGGRSQCAIWWLSVNNNNKKFQQWDRNDIIHLYQSEYSKQYLKRNGVTHSYQMTEYIHCLEQPSDCERSIDILYNTQKGIHYTDEILKRSGSAMTFRPIGGGDNGRKRISPAEVRGLLQRAKIYIDFGPHPGMDRLPREAALSGCVVITNMEGAAQHPEDVPLPPRYKMKSFQVEEIHKMLQHVLDNFEECSKDMESYRKWIRGQKQTMEMCVAKFLEEVVENREKKEGK